MNEERLPYKKIKLSDWQGILGNTDNSLAVFIEGYAGCGKSVFVQYLLKSQLNTFDYDNEYYNYDLGAHFQHSGSNRIKDAIFESFLDQLATCVIQGKLEIVEKFKEILLSKYIRDLDTSREIFYNFSTSEIFDKAVNLLFENRLIDNRENKDRIIGTFRITLKKQLSSFSIEQVLAVDYIFRIARYLINPEQRILYVCYDNMDAIENIDDLMKFDRTIISMRRNIDIFINDFFTNLEIESPRFVILATYRKITASKLKSSYRAERAEDFGHEDMDYVYYIDGSCFYHYEDFIKNRRDYFSCLIHPRTLHNNPQLHTERMIFSHIAYIDYCRLYFLSKTPNYEKKKETNSFFLDVINKYLEMYKTYIKPINPGREKIAKELEDIVEHLQSSSDEYEWLTAVECVKGRN